MPRQLDAGLWVVDHPDFRTGGVPIGTRTTLVRLADGGLWMHSPGPLPHALVQAIDAIGPVRFIVAPNAFHHFFVADAARAWPEASVHLAPGLAEKRKDLSCDAELGDAPPPAWKNELDQCLLRGVPRMSEVVFLHRASRTLIATDLAFNVREVASPFARLFFRLTGVYGKFATSRVLRLLTRDRGAARESVHRILAWDFDRVVVTHGEVLESGGREALRDALAWLDA